MGARQLAKKKPSTKKKSAPAKASKKAPGKASKPAAKKAPSKPKAKTTDKAPAKKPPAPKKSPEPKKATTAAKSPAKKPSEKSAEKPAKPTKPAAPSKAPAGVKSAPTPTAPAAKPSKTAPSKTAPAKPTPAAKGAKAAPEKSTKGSQRGGSRQPAAPAKSDAETFAEAQAAAARLAAIAGIRPIESRPFEDANAADDSKRLTKSPRSKKELTQYKDLLLRKRAEIMGDVVSMEDEALLSGDRMSHTPNHMAEQGSDVYEQTLSLDIAASQRKLVAEIEQALQRIEDGTYGVCVMMGTPIGKARLDAKPWAKYCIEAARRMERGGSLA